MKKIIRKLTLLVTMVMILMLNMTVSFGAGVTLNRATSMASYCTMLAHTDNINEKSDQHGKLVFKLGSQYAYCIEPNVNVSAKKSYSQTSDSVDDILNRVQSANRKHRANGTTIAQKKQLIGEVLSLIPGSVKANNQNEHIEWLVGQILIWEIVTEERDASFHKLDLTVAGAKGYKSIVKMKSKALQNTFDAHYDNLARTIESFHDIPSIASQSPESAPLYDITRRVEDSQDYELTLEDSLNLISRYELTSENCQTFVNGHTLTIRTQNAENALIKGVSTYAKQNTPVFWNDSGDGQRIVTVGHTIASDLSIYLRVSLKKGSLRIVKTSKAEEVGVKDAIFEVTDPFGHQSSYTTDANGIIRMDNLFLGEYSIEEIQAPDGFLINKDTFKATVNADAMTEIQVSEDEPKGTIMLKKSIEKSLTNENAGEADLTGVTYTLFAKEKIMDGTKTKIIYEKDKEVVSAVTNEKGEILFKDLPLGHYYIKETKTNESLALNEDMIDVDLDYQNQNTPLVEAKVETADRPKMQKVRIFKVSTEDLEKRLDGARFIIKSKEDVEKVGFEEAPVLYEGVTKDGFAESGYLPYGHYVFKEVEAPQGYQLSSMIVDFEINEDDPDHPLLITFSNAPIQNPIVITTQGDEYVPEVKVKAKAVKKGVATGDATSIALFAVLAFVSCLGIYKFKKN